MESWLEIVIRQIILYSLPMLVSLSIVGMLDAKLNAKPMPHAFYPLSWKGAWLPCLASIMFQRAVIFALPRYSGSGVRGAASRLGAHMMLCAAGFLLYAWSLQHPAVAGLPPLHHWWAKVLIFFNLCMVFLHLLPMPGMLLGEWLLPRLPAIPVGVQAWTDRLKEENGIWLWILLAATVLPDAILGVYGIFPVYERLATQAVTLLR